MRRVYVLPATGKTKLTSDVRKTQNGKRVGMTQDPKGRGADPDWLDPRKDRKTPYSDQELELLVEGFVSSMGDVADWNQMVKEIGEIKATVPNCAARSGLFKMFYVRWLLDYKRKRI